jgi:hypothetical protein
LWTGHELSGEVANRPDFFSIVRLRTLYPTIKKLVAHAVCEREVFIV